VGANRRICETMVLQQKSRTEAREGNHLVSMWQDHNYSSCARGQDRRGEGQTTVAIASAAQQQPAMTVERDRATEGRDPVASVRAGRKSARDIVKQGKGSVWTRKTLQALSGFESLPPHSQANTTT